MNKTPTPPRGKNRTSPRTEVFSHPVAGAHSSQSVAPAPAPPLIYQDDFFIFKLKKLTYNNLLLKYILKYNYKVCLFKNLRISQLCITPPFTISLFLD